MLECLKLMLIGNVPVRYLPNDTNKLMRVVRSPKTASASDLLSLRELAETNAGVDNLDLRIISAGGLCESQVLRGVPYLYVDD
jgi:hypothetical protein